MQIRARHFAVLTTALVACQGGGSATLETDDQRASYAIGLDVGNSLSQTGDHLDMAALIRGIEDARAGREPAVPQDTLAAVMSRFGAQIQEEQNAMRAEAAQRNLEEGAAYQAENAAKEGVVTTDSGLQYEVIRQGDGARPEATDRVTIHYRGSLTDGTEFDSSYGRGEPITLQVDGFISGFSEGLQLMSVGSHYRFVIPGEIGYGAQGSPPTIGPNQTLVFEVELLEIEQ